MTAKVTVLIVGNGPDADWHPLEPARAQIAGILGEEFILESSLDYDEFARLEPARYPVCISYTDCWREDLTPAQIAGLISYTVRGGSLLVIHNGISLHRSYEVLQMMGAKFTGHPPYQTLPYYGVAEGHPLLTGVEDFTLDEEPYMFEFDPFTKKTVFLEYAFEGGRYPAGWEQTYGLGKVIYLQPGHHAPSFEPEAYRRLVRNSVRWAAGQSVD
jgi:uncharacterized protein